MNYNKIYKSLIDRARVRQKPEVSEKHHIIPDFMFIARSRSGGVPGHLEGNPNDKNNLIHLTPREHLLAHILLARIYKNTRYEHQCLSSIVLMITKKKTTNLAINRSLVHKMSKGYSRLYEMYQLKGRMSISKHRKGTMPCRDVISGEIVGSYPIDHPNVISGKWVHHSKGKKLSEEEVDRIKLQVNGEKNPRFSGITNQQFFDEYLSLSKKMNFIPSFKFFRMYWFMKYNYEFPKTLSKFRFNGGKDLFPLLESETGLTYVKGQKTILKFNPKDYI